jgi:ATP-dependent exoDNAse (exonuclease V) alpha subunit
MHEVLARYILANTETRGLLYTPRAELERFGDVDSLVSTYNQKLYYKHKERIIKERNGHFYIRGYEDDTVEIIKKLTELSDSGVQNYNSYVNNWLSSGNHSVDCEDKKTALKQMFSQSSVAMIYGSAGTGKSTLIDHISCLFKDQSRLYLATNPAVDNMKRRVTTLSHETDFMTAKKFINNSSVQTKYDIVFIDECSTLSNKDMRDILRKAEFDLLVLVGDVYQIESIRFGNWFSSAKGFLPTTSIHELTQPWRSHNNENLQTLWDRVRNMDDRVVETIARQRYAVSLDNSIFTMTETDEIILCLNYDGLYGINNINRFLQEANPNQTVHWGIQTYKIGDPILFNDSERFAPVIYNNIKGSIVNIELVEDKIQFDVEVDKSINGLEARHCDFELLECSKPKHSLIRFTVDDHTKVDENREVPITAIVPFQVAYAVSIHKAQGLEFDSVKIVITDEVEDRITHSIFYTAITRTRGNLKIYWTPEVGQKILETITPKNNKRDIEFLKAVISDKKKTPADAGV